MDRTATPQENPIDIDSLSNMMVELSLREQLDPPKAGNTDDWGDSEAILPDFAGFDDEKGIYLCLDSLV